jgi:hypothetical protein
MRRLLLASLMGLTLTASTTFAADQDVTAVTVAAVALVPGVTAAAGFQVAPRTFAPRRPTILPALYGASALLQGYDAYSTLTVLKHGGIEANPMMKTLTKSPAAVIGLKAGMTVISIMAAERLWKGHNRVGAIVTMAVSNSVMAMVAANNAKVLNQMR